MREILFRGKRVDNEEWVYGLLMRHESYSYILPENPVTSVGVTRRYRVHPETVGQFTGLLDKNGDMIFEGDIVAEDSGYKGVVKMVEWQLFNGNIYCWGYTGKSFCENNMIVTEKIIGNIHDNKL